MLVHEDHNLLHGLFVVFFLRLISIVKNYQCCIKDTCTIKRIVLYLDFFSVSSDKYCKRSTNKLKWSGPI